MLGWQDSDELAALFSDESVIGLNSDCYKPALLTLPILDIVDAVASI